MMFTFQIRRYERIGISVKDWEVHVQQVRMASSRENWMVLDLGAFMAVVVVR